MLTKLKNHTIGLARGPNAERALFAVAFAESSFFPVPPDVLLGPMAAAEPGKWLRYALTCTMGSVVGGLFGYVIGYFFKEWLLQFQMFQSQLAGFHTAFEHWGIWIILIKGLLPVPYKLVTIASGLASFNLPMFIAASILTRGARFLFVSWLCQRFGPAIGPVVEKRLALIMLALGLVIIAGFVIAALMH